MSSATRLDRCMYDVPGLGVVHEIRDAWYDDGLAALAEDGASFLDYTARNSADARRRVPLEHDLNARGNWVAAEIAFGLPGLEHPLLVLGQARSMRTRVTLAAPTKRAASSTCARRSSFPRR
jgi:hypothetical protein